MDNKSTLTEEDILANTNKFLAQLNAKIVDLRQRGVDTRTIVEVVISTLRPRRLDRTVNTKLLAQLRGILKIAQQVTTTDEYVLEIIEKQSGGNAS